MRREFTGQRLYVTSQDDYVEVVLNRPNKRNAMDALMRDELISVVQSISMNNDASRVGLVGAGSSFSSGGDLSEFSGHDPVENVLIRMRRSLPQLFLGLSDRLTVGIHGKCVGAGVELAAFGYRVVAAEGTTFCLPELCMGLIPGMGGMLSIPRRIGRGRALEWLLLGGCDIDTTTALEWGLVDQVVPPAHLLETVRSASTAKLTGKTNGRGRS